MLQWRAGAPSRAGMFAVGLQLCLLAIVMVMGVLAVRGLAGISCRQGRHCGGPLPDVVSGAVAAFSAC